MKLLALKSGFVALAISLACWGSRTEASTVFSEDFENPAFDGTVEVNTTNSAFDLEVSGGGSFTVVNDTVPQLHHPNPTTGNTFTGTKYLRYSDTSSVPLLRGDLSSDLNNLFTLSFDYYETTATSGTQTAVRVALGSDTLSGAVSTNRVFEIDLHTPTDANESGDGTAFVIGHTNNTPFSFDPNDLVHFDIVGDFSTHTADVYINSVFQGTGEFRDATATVATEFGLISHPSGSRVQTAFFDNITITNVPEPSTATILILAAMGTLGRVRRR